MHRIYSFLLKKKQDYTLDSVLQPLHLINSGHLEAPFVVGTSCSSVRLCQFKESCSDDMGSIAQWFFL